MPDIEQVRDYLTGEGIEVLEFDVPTPSSVAAAAALNCSVAEIAKSILFLINSTPVLVVTSGDMKVKSSRLKQACGLTGKVRLPAAEDVERLTGYLPGGVCPFLLPEDLPVLIDQSLQRFQCVYPAGGNDFSGVPVSFTQLLHLTSGRVVDVCDSLSI